jgi:Periplasmic protease
LNVHDFWIRLTEWQPFFDGHTRTQHPDDCVEYLKTKKSLFFSGRKIRINQDKLYFGDMPGTPDSLACREITRINTIVSEEIIDNIMQHITHENQIISNLDFENMFCVIYPLLYGMPKKIEVEYIDRDTTKSITLTMDDFGAWDSIARDAFVSNSRHSAFNYFYYPEQGIALWEFNSFNDTFEALEPFRKKIDLGISMLHKHNIQHLFIDITQNGGGRDFFAYEFMCHLSALPDSGFRSKVSTKYNHSRGEFADTLSTDIYYYNKDKRDKEYAGNLYLIQSNYTYSAANTLSSFVKEYKLGTIIGEETGGMTACYIDSFMEELPNSKLVFYYAIKVFESPGGKWDGRGVIPDIYHEVGYKYRHKSFSVEELMQFISKE